MRLEDSFLGEFTRYSRALVGLGAASGSNNAQLVHATDETDDSELEVAVSDEGSVDSSEDEGDVDADGENEQVHQHHGRQARAQATRRDTSSNFGQEGGTVHVHIIVQKPLELCF